MRIFCVLGVVLVTAISSAFGNTWYVEQDGSGDFTTIQPAVDAAAPGDTIRIGPGRFDEGQVITNSGWSEFVRVFVTKDNLTFVGSGRDSTIIGQAEPWDLSQGRNKGFVAYPPWANGAMTIRNMRFENIGDAIYTENLAETIFSECAYVRNHHSVMLLGGHKTTIDSCILLDNARDEMVVYSSYQDTFIMRDCTVTLDNESQWTQAHVRISGTEYALIESCEFYGGHTGLGVSSGARIAIKNSRFDGQSATGVYHGGGSTFIEIKDSVFKNQEVALYQIHQGGFWDVERVRFEDVGWATLLFYVLGEGGIRNCDLARGERHIVEGLHYKGQQEVYYFDMTNNYWGTDNPDSIAAWIYDANDTEMLDVVIDYEPFFPVSVPTQQQTQGSLRRMYR